MVVPSGPVWLGLAMSRQAMPTVAKFIDELREAFGKVDIDAVIRTGLKPDCEPRRRFFASEGGQEVGKRYAPPGIEVSPTRWVFDLGPVKTVRGRR